jgi:putative endonuclease
MASQPSLMTHAKVAHRAHATNRRRMSTEARGQFKRAKVDCQDARRPESLRGLTTAVSKPCVRFTGHQDRALIAYGRPLARSRGMRKRFVYVLRNAENPPRYYTGLTSDVATRHATHDAGSCRHTAKHRPWSIDVVIEFADERRAVAFERYLKSGSGVAFAKRHLR